MRTELCQISPIGGQIIWKLDVSFPARHDTFRWSTCNELPRWMALVLKWYIEDILLGDRKCCEKSPYKLNIFIEFVEDYDISHKQSRIENLYFMEKQKESCVKRIPILNLITRDLQEKMKKRVCPLYFIKINFLMAHQMCPRCDTHLLIFLAMMHDSSYWCAVGGEQYISQHFTTFTYFTEAKVMMEWVQCIMVDTDSAIISQRTPEMFIALMFRRCGEQNYVPDLVVQCACYIIQIVLWHTYIESWKPFHYYSLSVCMYKFFQKLRLPHLLKQVCLECFQTFRGRSRKHWPSYFEKCMSHLQRSHIHLIM